MIRVTIELWPGGSSARKKLLGVMNIANMGGLAEDKRGDYHFALERPGGTTRVGQLFDFPRRSRSAFELLRRCLNSVRCP